MVIMKIMPTIQASPIIPVLVVFLYDNGIATTKTKKRQTKWASIITLNIAKSIAKPNMILRFVFVCKIQPPFILLLSQ